MNKEVILGFVKKNMLSLICALVAILAIGAAFYPLGGMVQSLQQESDASAQDYNTISGFSTRQRKLPINDPKAEPGSLTIFPNKPTIQAGTDVNTKLSQYSTQMFSHALEMNQKGHDLLVADEFPLPTLDTTYFTFANLYKLVLSTDPLISAIGDPTTAPSVPPDPTLAQSHHLNLQNDILHGGLPPTNEEILAARDDLKKNTYDPQLIYKNQVAVNQAEVDSRFAAEAALLPLKMKGEAAKKHRIYVEKDAFTVNPAIVPGQKPNLMDMWYAQMQVWIQQDLAMGISEENNKLPSHNVLDAPVKRLIRMEVPTAPMYVFPPASAASGQSASSGNVPATAKETDSIPPLYTVSVTGRYSNAMYDVVPFRLVVDVDATKVNEFIETLSDQRFITITNENEFALDPEVESKSGFLYGPGATVRLQLDGEILFMRSWTEKLMPDPVKVNLGLIQGATPGGNPSMPPPPMGRPGGGPGMPPGGFPRP